MKAPYLALMFCLALVAFALTSPDVNAGGRSHGCSAPTLADDYGCSAPAAASCGGERSILRGHRGEGRWFPGKLIIRGTARVVRGTVRVALAPVRAVGRIRFAPQPRGYGRRCH